MSVLRRLCSVLAILLGLSCAGKTENLPEGLMSVDHPDLGAIEAVARRQLEEQRSTITAALDKRHGHLELADAFGGMGELYHAYELMDAAAACYQNAEMLDPESFLWPYYLGALQQSAGNLEAAASSLERALEKRGNDRPGRQRLGEVRLALGDIPAAREQFQTLLDGPIEDNAFAAAATFGLGRAAAASGELEEAVANFERTLELQPSAGIVHYSLGLALRRLGRLDEAQEQLDTKGSGEVLFPDRLMERNESLAISSGAHLKRGNRALMSGRLGEAEAELRRAVAANAQATGARRNLAMVLARGGDADGAIKELEEAATIDPDDVWIYIDLGNAHLSKGLVEPAVRSLKRAVELDPTLVQAHFNLANAFIGLQRWSEARPHIEATLRLDPGHSRARYQLAMANHHAGDSRAAIRDLRSLLEEEPAFTIARNGLTAVLVETKQIPKAIAVYRQSLELDLPSAERVTMLNALANLSWRQGQTAPAIDYWRQITVMQPTSSEAWMNLANALQHRNKREEAMQLFARAVELDSSNATAWLSEARLRILSGEFATARQRLEAALAAVPNHPGLVDTLARLLATCSDAGIRDGQRAMDLARKAYALESSIPHAETFGMALIEAGHFEEAVRWQRSLVNEAARTGDQAALPRLVANLKRYENRQPVRMSVSP